ncbi:uncharacterized protein FIBRA_00225 [Fibroporia radiculosa]|uniref:RRM domain-containing protein n=1 Tax=Fibroporia radiculosa TaxID=599839 RepID=J7SBY4_9APHY|nr:uncharacterized protein FIBRA_00225 [Fibroporia radiculosa]CCL98231.1 predicted protein [Fibroporia radiculosa]
MAAPPNPVFRFNRETCSIKVENVAESVTRQEIADLFATLIGDVSKCDESMDGARRVVGLTFRTHDAAQKALCMSGYNVAGVPLVVTACLPSDNQKVARQGKQGDGRRNLYVLGLPFDLTKSEFVDIFSRYGTVAHAVILATVDNASRRRGFVVMSSFSEARAAMDGLSRREIKGHTIDVSWAVVQRSQGFLDGGDRTTVLASQSPSPSPSPFEFRSLTSSPSSGQVPVMPTPQQEAPLCDVTAPLTSLLVTNLPAVLFSQISDLKPLFYPYGDIQKLDILGSGGFNLNQDDISVVVEYATVAQARDAQNALHGQLYSNNPVKVEFLKKSKNETPAVPLPSRMETKTGLNPRAAPFVAPTGQSMGAVLNSATFDSSFSRGHAVPNVSNGLLAVNSYALPPYATPPGLHSHLYPSVDDNLRPNSAPSPWAEPTQHLRPGHWAFSQLHHFPNSSTPSLGQTFTT